jgi:hypothetical protein
VFYQEKHGRDLILKSTCQFSRKERSTRMGANAYRGFVEDDLAPSPSSVMNSRRFS